MFNAIDHVGRMTPYASEHIAALATTVVAAVVLVWAARRVRDTAAEHRALTIAGIVMLAATLTWMVWNLLPQNWNIEQSLPFHLSDALRLVTSFAALLAPIVFVWGLGYRPTWRGYVIGLAATLVWASLAAVANVLTGANYMYLARAPEVPSALDLLGQWPVYLFWALVLIAGVWALMTWPWNLKRAGEMPVVDRLAAVRRSQRAFENNP